MPKASSSVIPTTLWRSHDLPTLFERYQILGILGQGGMGTVSEGYHTAFKRFVAVKTVRIDRNRHFELVDRFLREVEAIGQMDHPNVVPASDAGEKNGVLYLVMEYLIGTDLGKLIADRGRLEAADACEAARQAALGLASIHQTLVHRDIKPSNLMLNQAGSVKVLDLGLARFHEAEARDGERTPEGCFLGTLDYMAPEQADGRRQIDGRADLYSLGCTLFKLLTGRAPFSGPPYDCAAKKLYGHCHVPLTAVEEFSSIPEALRPVLLRMTAKDPCERYAAAMEVALALAPFAAGSRLSRLLGGLGGPPEPALQALPAPLPEELSRLTDEPYGTPVNTPILSTTVRRRVFPAWPVALLGAGLLGCAVTASILFLATAVSNPIGKREPLTPPQPLGGELAGKDSTRMRETGEEADPGPRNLDALPTDAYHLLLDRRPLCLNGVDEHPSKWHWYKGQQLLDVKWHDLLLLQLGTTSRKRFVLEANMLQAPWTGSVGFFWGYQEDLAAKSARATEQPFVRFQMILLDHRRDRNVDRYSVHRGKGSMQYDATGAVQYSAFWEKKHNLPLLAGGEKVLVIEIDKDQLRRALFGGTDLKELCTPQTNKTFASHAYRGGLGLMSLGHQTTFGPVRFLSSK